MAEESNWRSAVSGQLRALARASLALAPRAASRHALHVRETSFRDFLQKKERREGFLPVFAIRLAALPAAASSAADAARKNASCSFGSRGHQKDMGGEARWSDRESLPPSVLL
jgi:hypothetical protein